MSDKNFKVKNGLDANGAVTITQPSTSTVPLTILANTLATGSNLLEVKRPDGTVRFAVGNDGALTVNSNISFNGGSMSMYPGNSGQTALSVFAQTNQSVANLIVKAATNQSGNLQEWRDQNNTVAARIGPDFAFRSIAGGFFGTATGNIVGSNYLGVRGWAEGHIPFVVQGVASQTGDLTRWVDSSANTLAKVDASGSITAVDLTLSGNLTVNGTTTNLNSTNLIIEDKNIIIADVATPTNTTADGAGITIKGATDKTFNWVQSTGRFTSSEPIQSSAFISTEVYASQIGSTVIGTATLNTNSDTGGILVNTAGAANKGLIIRGANSQTANLQQWQTSNGTTLMQVGGGGDLFMSSATRAFFGGSDTAGYVNISTAGNGGRQGLVIKSASSQTANLQEWQNSSGAVLAAINPVGQFFTGSIPFYTIASTTTAASGNGTTATITTTSAHNIAVGDFISVSGITPAGYNGTYLVTAVPTSTQISYANTTTGSQTVAGSILISAQATITARSNMSVGLTVKAGANAPAQTWQNSLGAQIARVDNTGNIVVAEVIASNLIAPFGYALIGTSYSRFSTAMISVASTTAASQGIIVRGADSQTANLQEWQNSAGTVAASINSGGSLSLNRSLYASASLGVWASVNGDPQGGATGNALTVQTYNTTSKGIVILGQASQTANLQEWQNSAGTVLVKVDASGNFDLPNGGIIKAYYFAKAGSGTSVITLTGDDNIQLFTALGGRSGAGNLFISNSTTVPSSNPTNGGVIYIESGSLKYRGQGGAITTIASSSLDDQEDIENSEVQLIQYGAEGSVLQNLPTRIHPAEQLLKESVLWLDPAHSSAGSQTIQNLGWGGTALNATAGENTSVSTDQPKYLSWEGENYIYATGEAGNFMISSASTSLGMTTSSDLDMRVKVSLDALSGINQMFISTWWYRLYLTSSGYVSLSWHDNTAFNNINSSNLLSSIATVGQEIWIRGTLKLNNGSGVSEVKFYTSINGTTWTQLGTTYNGASTSILGAGGRSLMAEVGSLDGGVASPASGKIYRAQVLQGVDGVVVFDCDTSLVSSGSTTTFNALTGHIMTITRSTVGRKMVAVTHPLWLFGTDDYLKIAHNNLLDFATNQPFTIFLSSREFASTAGTTILLSKGGYGVWQGYTITSQNSYTQAYFSGPQANSSYYYSGNLGKSTTSRNYFYGRSTTNTFSYVNNNLIGGSEEVAPQYDTSNNYDFYLGRQVTGAYSNMEVFGVAIWRRALTSAEIATVSRYYEGRAI